MKIGLFVEGKSDKETLRALSRRILGKDTSVIPRTFRARGNLLNERKVGSVGHVLLQKSPEVSKIIVCVDSECTPKHQTEREIKKIEKLVNTEFQDKCDVQFIAVIHALEGWLLTDPDAVINYLGSEVPIRIPKGAASNCRPKELMKEVFRKANKDYMATRDAPRIAEGIDIDKVVNKNESFARFRECVADSSNG